MSLPPWQEIRCGMPGCGRDADIVCSALDGPERGTGATMAMCVVHFWLWNEASLRRRGIHAAADALDYAIRTGQLDELPPEADRSFTGFQVAGHDRRRPRA